MVLPPDEPNEEERLEQLPQDYDTPFHMPDEKKVDIADSPGNTPQRPELDDTHPATDSNFEISEAYQDGMAATADASEPNPNDAVIGHDDFDDEDKAA